MYTVMGNVSVVSRLHVQISIVSVECRIEDVYCSIEFELCSEVCA